MGIKYRTMYPMKGGSAASIPSPEPPPELSHITLVGSADSVYAANGQYQTVQKPEGIQEGDILLAMAYLNSAGTIIYPPSGWTELVFQPVTGNLSAVAGLYYKIATDSEPDTYEFSFNYDLRTCVTIWAYTNVSATSPIAYYDFFAGELSNPPTTKEVTSENDRSLLVIGDLWDTSVARIHTVPDGFTEVINSPDSQLMFVAHQEIDQETYPSVQVATDPTASGGCCVTLTLLLTPKD